MVLFPYISLLFSCGCWQVGERGYGDGSISYAGLGKDCLILIPFRPPQISCFTAFSVSPLAQTVAPMWGSDSCFIPPPAEGRPSPANTPVSPLVLHPTKFCMLLYILFRWSGTPVRSQLVFCVNFCVWRCIPDVSVERDVLHVHLLLHYLVLSFIHLKMCTLLIYL